jgi:transposase
VVLCMSQKERDRLGVMRQLKCGELTQGQAAKLLGLSSRQVRRLTRRYQAEGDAGLVHRLRNRQSNRRISAKVEEQVVGLLRKRYLGFGPTLAAEYLLDKEKISVSRETLRGWMVERKLWNSHPRRVRARQWRERRACFGELVQMDTSIHEWFEERGEKAVLISMIDDATSRLWTRFYPADSTSTNMAMLCSYFRRFGRPVALYADKASHFKTTRRADLEEALEGRGAETQIARALRELGIQYIAANSPQAKGRVERSFQTAQDRLVKGMRLERISTIAEANRYLEKEFLPSWNRLFTVKPTSLADAHRPLGGHDLNAILSVQETRTVGNDYTLRHGGKLFQLDSSEITVGLKRSKVIVEERLDGGIKLRWRGRYLGSREINKQGDANQPTLRARTPVGLRPSSVRARKKPGIPAPDHPWRNGTFLSCRKADISTLR